jgi:hypothetical protein
VNVTLRSLLDSIVALIIEMAEFALLMILLGATLVAKKDVIKRGHNSQRDRKTKS